MRALSRWAIELQRDPRRLSLTIDDASLSVAKQ